MKTIPCAIAAFAVASLAQAAEPPTPIAVHVAASRWTHLPDGDVKALVKEREAAWKEAERARFALADELKKRHGGKFEKWPAEAKERWWDAFEDEAAAESLWRDTWRVDGKNRKPGDAVAAESDIRSELSKALAKKKALVLVDDPRQADLVAEVIAFLRVKLAPGPRLGALPPESIDQEVFRKENSLINLRFDHRYTAAEPYWTISCCVGTSQSQTTWFAHLVEQFAKANHAALIAARREP